MTRPARRVVTGHDGNGKSIILSDGEPPQHHTMRGPGTGADFIEMWNTTRAPAPLTSVEPREPNEKPFTIMPASGGLIRRIDIYPASQGGRATPMHRTRTIDHVVVIDGEITLILDDSEVTLRPSDVVIQRGTNHAWENRSGRMCRLAFMHFEAEFTPELRAKLPDKLELMT